MKKGPNDRPLSFMPRAAQNPKMPLDMKLLMLFGAAEASALTRLKSTLASTWTFGVNA